MNYCQKCGARLPEGRAVCSMCGFDNAQAARPGAEPHAQPFNPGGPAYGGQGQPYGQPNQTYGAPYGQPPHDSRRDPLSVGDIFVSWLLLSIPIVNIVMIIVWLTSSSTNINKKNFAKAALIMYAIGIVLWILAAIVFSIVGVGTVVALDDYIYYMIPLLGL